MPIRKVWRESRSRFFFILVTLLVVTSASVFYNAKAERVVIESKDFHEAGVRTIRGALFCSGVFPLCSWASAVSSGSGRLGLWTIPYPCRSAEPAGFSIVL